MIEAGFYKVRDRAPWPGEKKGEGGPESVRFQAMRVGYFVSGCILSCAIHRELIIAMLWQALDSDSTDDKIVLNRIVPLKEDSSKNS